MINNVVLIGRTTKDVDMKYTNSGTAVASLTLAVERSFKNANGEKQTDFINIVAWKKTAEILAQYAPKGSMIGINGSIQTRNYENQQGQKVYVTEVLANEVQLIDTRNGQNNAQAQQNNQQGVNASQQPQNANSGQNTTNQQQGFTPGQMYGNATDTVINDNDLPF